MTKNRLPKLENIEDNIIPIRSNLIQRDLTILYYSSLRKIIRGIIINILNKLSPFETVDTRVETIRAQRDSSTNNSFLINEDGQQSIEHRSGKILRVDHRGQ